MAKISFCFLSFTLLYCNEVIPLRHFGASLSLTIFVLSKINNFPFLTFDLAFISIYSGFTIEDLLTVSDCRHDKIVQYAHSQRVMLKYLLGLHSPPVTLSPELMELLAELGRKQEDYAKLNLFTWLKTRMDGQKINNSVR